MLRYLGIICIFLFAFYAVFSYERYQKNVLLQGEDFLLLLKFFVNEMEGLARPSVACIRDFRATALSKTAFLPALLKGEAPDAAYRAARGSLCLPKGLDAILSEAFEDFGRGGRREEGRRLAQAAARAETLLSKEREEHTRRLTLCRTLTAASALGLVILLM